MPFDLVIKNGVVIDGSGLPRFRADVGVKGGRIASIGRIRESAKEVLDAEGHVVVAAEDIGKSLRLLPALAEFFQFVAREIAQRADRRGRQTTDERGGNRKPEQHVGAHDEACPPPRAAV